MKHSTKTSIHICILLLTIILISACTQGGPRIPQENIRLGTNGLDVKLLTPIPEPLFENTPLQLVFELNNEGAYDIRNGIFSIETERPYVQVPGQTQRPFQLDGRSPTMPDGDFTTLSFQTQIHSINPASRTHNTLIHATACYDYKTILTTDVCIDTDPFNQRINPRDKPCQARDLNPRNQGAPISIDRVELRTYHQDNTVYLPEFVIHIKNVRNGFTFSYDQVQSACSSSIVPDDDIGKIVLYAQLSETTLQCDRPIVNMQRGQARVVCGLPAGHAIDGALSTYVAPLYIELNYGYMETFTTTFDIKRQ